MYPRSTVSLALFLSGVGVLDQENALICGVSVGALRHWRYGNRRTPESRPLRPEPRCPQCDGRPLDKAAYAYLLGLYLGDGTLTCGRREVYALCLQCCDSWPGLITAAKDALSAVMPSSRVCCRHRIGCTEVKSYSTHWPCLFPQHGPGRKHQRRIVLEPWQQAITAEFAGQFARGLFHSDGCRFTNRVRRPLLDGDHWYEYPRYMFTNESMEILNLCVGALDQLGISWRFSRPNTISVARREAVARLDTYVGPKY
jgi:hypothetical protein